MHVAWVAISKLIKKTCVQRIRVPNPLQATGGAHDLAAIFEAGAQQECWADVKRASAFGHSVQWKVDRDVGEWEEQGRSATRRVKLSGLMRFEPDSGGAFFHIHVSGEGKETTDAKGTVDPEEYGTGAATQFEQDPSRPLTEGQLETLGGDEIVVRLVDRVISPMFMAGDLKAPPGSGWDAKLRSKIAAKCFGSDFTLWTQLVDKASEEEDLRSVKKVFDDFLTKYVILGDLEAWPGAPVVEVVNTMQCMEMGAHNLIYSLCCLDWR